MSLLILTLALATPISTPPSIPQEVVQPQEVRPLPGRLDEVLTFNSNSPEVVQTEGILLSTFPGKGKTVPGAHLKLPLKGRFDFFAHHIAKGTSPTDWRTLYLGGILYNPSRKPIKVKVLQAASYLSQPDAPFIELPSQVENPLGTVYAGPGDRATNDILRGQRQAEFPTEIEIPPQGYRLLLNHPIPVKLLVPPLNGRSTLMRLQSSSPVYVATLAMFARSNSDGSERAPTLEEWQKLLLEGNLAGPRDKAPTPPGQSGAIVYGRVAGVAKGQKWQAVLVDPKSKSLSIPQPGRALSYGIGTLPGGMLGTQQVQSAPMLVRYPDTAYRAHGNYGIQYSLSLPLVNKTDKAQTVTVAMQTPLKQDKLLEGLRFLAPPGPSVWFRGTVQVRYQDDRGLTNTRYVHLVQKRGQQGEPLVTLNLPAGDRRSVKIDFLYPPDATPPQVITVRTLGN
jgi:hypothetical protein